MHSMCSEKQQTKGFPSRFYWRHHTSFLIDLVSRAEALVDYENPMRLTIPTPSSHKAVSQSREHKKFLSRSQINQKSFTKSWKRKRWKMTNSRPNYRNSFYSREREHFNTSKITLHVYPAKHNDVGDSRLNLDCCFCPLHLTLDCLRHPRSTMRKWRKKRPERKVKWGK